MSTKFLDNFDDSGNFTISADHVKQYIEPIHDLETGQAWFRTDSGAKNAHIVDFSDINENGLDATNLVDGQIISFKAVAANDAPATLTLNGTGSSSVNLPIKKNGNVDLASGDIQQGQMLVVLYNSANGGRFEMAAGTVGPQGPTGPQGPAGADGADGTTGPQGSTGPQGPAGADGADGATGPQGSTGPQGPAGADGADGATGPQGAIGPQGLAGADGVQGPPGADGTAGIDGAPGPQGPAGADGNDGAVGPQGPQGDVGPAGPQGPIGPQGQQGETGPQGPPGVVGTVPVSQGGTGATTAAEARTNLGTNNAANITTGTLPVARGGTGATTSSAARAALQVPWGPLTAGTSGAHPVISYSLSGGNLYYHSSIPFYVNGDSSTGYLASPRFITNNPLSSTGTNAVITSSGHIAKQSSQSKFKENQKPLDTTIEDLQAWKPKKWTWAKALGGREDIGLVAEEVAKLDPLAVRWDHDTEIEFDEDGKSIGAVHRDERPIVPCGVHYDRTWVHLLAAVQDFYRLFRDEQAKTAYLEERLSRLEKTLG